MKKLNSETEQVVVGQLETARMVEMTRKSGSEIGFVGEYLSIYHHKILRGGPRAMPSGVCQGRLLDRPRPVHLDPDRPVLDRRFKRITYEKKQKLMNVVFAIGSN